MKILYAALKYDYKDPSRGYSFEHCNFYESLVKMNGGEHEIVYFPFDEIELVVGKDAMNRQLVETALAEKPDLCFFFLFADEIRTDTLGTLRTRLGVPMINWFGDDHWKFDAFSRIYAPFFDFSITTDKESVRKYQSIACPVILSQWACNHFSYISRHDERGALSRQYTHDVTFVGQPHSNRKSVIASIRRHSINVEAFGKGWENGRVTQEEMIRIFQESKINLNLTKSSTFWSIKGFGRIFFKKKNRFYAFNTPREMVRMATLFFSGSREQIKGRNFEVPGCGGFLLTGDVEHLSDYYEDGKEIVTFKDPKDMLSKIKYYLIHDDEREKIRTAGYQRTMREHTYEKRFTEIFKAIFP